MTRWWWRSERGVSLASGEHHPCELWIPQLRALLLSPIKMRTLTTSSKRTKWPTCWPCTRGSSHLVDVLTIYHHIRCLLSSLQSLLLQHQCQDQPPLFQESASKADAWWYDVMVLVIATRPDGVRAILPRQDVLESMDQPRQCYIFLYACITLSIWCMYLIKAHHWLFPFPAMA